MYKYTNIILYVAIDKKKIKKCKKNSLLIPSS